MDVCRLYPQYNLTQDRRTQSTASGYTNDRRSGADRRAPDRIKLDTGLTKDIFEVRNKITEMKQSVQQKVTTDSVKQTATQKIDKTTFSQNIPKAAQNSLQKDIFVKTAKPDFKETPQQAAESNADAISLGGLMAVVLGGTIAATFLGVAGIGIAVGLGAYFGGKLLKTAVVEHLASKINKK